MAQMDVFIRGRIIGMYEAGMKPSAIAQKVSKTDQRSPKVDSVRKTIRKHELDKRWGGERKAGSGRPPLLSAAIEKRIVNIVFAKRGRDVVTVKCIKKAIPSLRMASDQTNSRALRKAGLAWLVWQL